MIQLTHDPLDPADVVRQATSPQAGAVVLFLGITREFTGERQTRFLNYDAFAAMAEKKLAELEAEARRRWPIVECVIVHRLGRLELEEASVAIAVSTPHRQDAFEAAKWIIDTLKEVVPIWKEEHWADGTTEWVHPGFNRDTPSK